VNELGGARGVCIAVAAPSILLASKSDSNALTQSSTLNEEGLLNGATGDCTGGAPSVGSMR